MKTIRLINLFLAVVPVAFVGCGGGESQPQTPAPQPQPQPQQPQPQQPQPQGPQTPQILHYRTQLNKTSSLMQSAMNNNDIQYIDGDFINNIKNNINNNNNTYSFALIATPYIMSDSVGYSFITLKFDDKVILEAAFTWNQDNHIYGLGIRGLSLNDPSINTFEFTDRAETLFPNRNLDAVKDLANFLKKDLKISSSVQIRNDKLYLSNIRCTRNNITKPISTISDISFDSYGILSSLVLLNTMYNHSH